ncbi:hypothetical protein LX16_3876 [Stackebrandtia albiflava]|uniref:Uncharacterized protein n=1 Tax=Stackebrandtia albiflava TaxID=406432 RepID=A0A562UXV6_9ACTN|nr:hypothetical protein [Stackebrandtia albiflava]TWJ10459.1 hypothetical protein LX16_3876 [Stackebrandtia albiflava]
MRYRVTGLAMSVLLGVTACSAEEPATPGESPLISAIEETNTLVLELGETYHRLLRDCMALREFQVHPQWLNEPVESLYGPILSLPQEPPGYSLIPEPAVAAENGFGVWASTAPDPRREQPDEFSAMNETYRDSYLRAMYGDDLVDNLDPDFGVFSGDGQDVVASLRMAAEDARSGDAAHPVGGCYAEVTDQVFADPDEFTPGDYSGGLPGMGFWPDLFHGSGIAEEFEIAMEPTWREWNDCTVAEGYDPLTVDAEGSEIQGYVRLFYRTPAELAAEAGEFADEIEEQFAAVPVAKGAPWPYEEAKRQEFAYAAAAAECGETVGLWSALDTGWDELLAVRGPDLEAEVFAYRQAVSESLTEAQGLLK